MLRLLTYALLICISGALHAQEQLSQNRVERLYQRGTDLINHANYGAAREVFTDFLANATPSDTRRGEAEYYVAFSALNLGHRDGEKLIDQFITRNPSSPKASTAYYDLANFFYNEGNYAKASSYFRRVSFPSLTNEQQTEGHFKWGYSFFNQKRLDDALEQFNFVKKQNGAYMPAASYYAGFIESSKGLYDEALTDLRRAESSPSYANIVPYLVTTIYYKQKKYDSVIEYASTLSNRKDVANSSDISMLVAEAYYYKGDYKNAIEAYQRYFDKNARADGGLLFRAGYANYIAGNTNKGIEYLDKAAASKDTVSYYASYYLGILHLKAGNKPLALNAFDYARRNPADKSLAEESAFQLGKVAYDAGKPDQAIPEFERFMKTYPASKHTNEVKELLAQAYVNGNNYNKAIEYIESLPSRNPLLNQAYQKATYLKGSEHFNKEQYNDAISFFERSMKYPESLEYLALASFWNGEAYSINGQYEQAATNYQRVIAMLPNVEPELLLKTRYGLGYAYYNTKQYDKALFNFKDFTNRSNKNTPNYADGLIRLADCYYVSRQYSDALATYNKAKTTNAAEPDYILLQSANIAGVLKKYGEAKNSFNELISKYPRSRYRDEAFFQRAEFDIEQSNYALAAEGLSQMINEGRGSRYLPFAYLRRAVSYYNLKQYDKTVADYSTLIQRFPAHPASKEALPLLQESLNLTGRSDEYDRYLNIVVRANPDSKDFENLEYEAAKNYYFNQQYDKAITSMNSFLGKYPQSPNVLEGRYYLAESHYRLKQFDLAIPIYNELINNPAFTMTNRVASRLGEVYFRDGKYDNAIAAFKQLERVASTKREQFTAWSGLMESFYLQEKYDSTETYARIILERGNVNAGAQNKASLYLGKAALAKGDLDSAKDEFLNTLNSARDEYGAEAKYLLGWIFHNQKEYKQAYETLVSLNTDFAAYEDWVGKSFLLLADNFIAQDDIFQARHTLQSLVDNFPLAEIKDQARTKLAELEKLELEKEKQTEADTLDN